MTELNNNEKYSRSKIYTIKCKTNTSLIYIGYTTESLSIRWSHHKGSCNNVKNKSYNLNVYKIMRDNGGFENFYIELYENFICNNRKEIEIRERELIILIGTMNKNQTRTIEEQLKFNNEKHKKYLKKYNEKNYYRNRNNIFLDLDF